MDSSPSHDLQTILQNHMSDLRGLTGVYYVHLPGVNQSRLRNEGLQRLGTRRIRYVLFLDSDIYLDKSTLKICSDYLNKDPTIAALAPPLVSYSEGSCTQARDTFGKIIRGSKAKLIMPSKLDFKLFNPEAGTFIESHMLRGAFIIRRNCLKLIGDRPWHESFEVWQNVDFFLNLREMKRLFGYILETRAICLHDERVHPDSIRSWMPKFHEQTIKSLILLFHRNQLWRVHQRTLNRRFWNTIRPVVREHCLASVGESLKEMLEVARCLSLTRRKKDAHAKLRRVRSQTTINEIKLAIDLLMDDVWSDIKSIKSRNLSQSM